MYVVATPWVKRLRTVSAAMAEGSRAVSQEQFEDILRSKRPHSIAAIGFVGLLAILYLMVFKPTLGFGGVPECPVGADAVTVCAFDDQRFVPDTLTAPGDEAFVLDFVNEDAGVQHNVAIYRDASAEESLFVGDLTDGSDGCVPGTGARIRRVLLPLRRAPADERHAGGRVDAVPDDRRRHRRVAHSIRRRRGRAGAHEAAPRQARPRGAPSTPTGSAGSRSRAALVRGGRGGRVRRRST